MICDICKIDENASEEFKTLLQEVSLPIVPVKCI